MTPEEHQEIIQQERLGRTLIGVHRPEARQFFTTTARGSVQAVIGEPLYLDRFVVTASFILGYLMVLLAVAASAWAFGWWALVAAPLIIVLWGGYLAGSTRGHAGLGFSLIAIAAAAAIYFFAPLPNPAKICLLLVAGALFFARFTYTSAVFFLRALVIRNWRAFAALEASGLVVHEVVS